jgi:2-dehydropantoate 2-reductase
MPRVVIAGAGALGSLYAALLVENGADVAILAHGAHARAVGRRGIELRLPGGDVRRVHVRLDDEAAGDIVLLTSKAFSSGDVLSRIRGEPLLAVSFQNGPTKNDALVARFGPRPVAGAVSMAAAEILEPGVVMCSTVGTTYLDEGTAGTRGAAAELAGLLERAGFPVHLTDEIESVEWSKLAAVCGLMAVQLASDRFVHEILRERDSAVVMKALATEVAGIARRRGTRVRDWPGLLPAAAMSEGSVEEVADMLRATAARLEAGGATAYRTSLLQDSAAGRPTELDLIHGETLRIAVEEGVATPVLETCYRLCRLRLLGSGGSTPRTPRAGTPRATPPPRS